MGHVAADHGVTMPAATQGGIRPGLTPLDGTQSCAPHPAQTCASPGRTLFETTDPEQVGHCFQRAFGSVLSIRVEAPSVLLRIERIDAGGCRLDEVALDGVSVTAEGHDVLRVCQPTGGTIDWRQRRVSDRFGDGDVAILADPQVGHWCRWHDASATVVTVSGEQIRRAAAGDPDARTGRVGFTGHRPFSAAAARQWVHTVAYVTESLTCEGGAAAPLVAGSAARLLAATALATFPNTSVLDERPVDRTDATPETVRRALAFIESSADHPIGVDDIAQAACVTVRAVQLAFRRHLDTTPMAHLRRIRLDRAHEDLHRARPDDGTTVTQVAARWGFPSPSRFSMLYRAEYAQLPSETLRDAGS